MCTHYVYEFVHAANLDYTIDSGLVNVTKFPFTFNVTLREDNLLEGDELFTLNLEIDHNSIQLAPFSSSDFTIIDSVSSCLLVYNYLHRHIMISMSKCVSHTHFCYTLQTRPTIAAVAATIIEIGDIISNSRRTENDLERIAGSIQRLAGALSIVAIREEVGYLPPV